MTTTQTAPSAPARALPVPFGGQPYQRTHNPSRQPTADEPVRSLTRAALTTGLAAFDSRIYPADFAAKNWPEDRAVPLLLKGSVSPSSLADSPSSQNYTVAFLDALVHQSAAADLLGRGLRLSFDTGSAGILIPGFAPPTASFVGEGQLIPVQVPPSTPPVILERNKLAVILTATSELLLSPNAEPLLRQLLMDATGPALDGAMLSPHAGDEERPPGLLYGITPLPPTGDLEGDITAVLSAVAPIGAANLVIVASSELAVTINVSLRPTIPYPVLASSQLPQNVIIAIALNALVSAAQGAPQINASTAALIHENSDPQLITLDNGIRARPLRSFFQSDVVGLRLRWFLSWALRAPTAIAWIQR